MAAFDKGRQLAEAARPDLKKTLDTWLRKCGAELADDATVAAPATAARPAATVAPVATTAASSAPTASTASAGAGSGPSSEPQASSAGAVPVPRHVVDWYQSPTHVTVTLLAKGAIQEKSSVNVTATSVRARR